MSSSTAKVAARLAPGATISSVSLAYRYCTGYKGASGANFTLAVAGMFNPQPNLRFLGYRFALTVDTNDWGTTTRGVEPATPNLMEAKQNTTEPQ